MLLMLKLKTTMFCIQNQNIFKRTLMPKFGKFLPKIQLSLVNISVTKFIVWFDFDFVSKVLCCIILWQFALIQIVKFYFYCTPYWRFKFRSFATCLLYIMLKTNSKINHFITTLTRVCTIYLFPRPLCVCQK